MKIHLCLGDRELLEAISKREITDDGNLNDSQRRSARYLYNQELISALPNQDYDANIEDLAITPKGRERLKQSDST